LVACDIYEFLLPRIGGTFCSQDRLALADLADFVASDIESLKVSPLSKSRPFTGAGPDYVGLFSNAGYGDLSVSLRGSELQLNYYQLKWPLTRIATDLYFFSLDAFGGNYPVVPVVFNRTPSGEVDKVTVPLEAAVKPIQFTKR
jgi:hypothetical protein